MKVILSAFFLIQALSADTLLFSTKLEGVCNIYESSLDGATPRKITVNTEVDAISRRPIASPDGSKIAYSAPHGEMLTIYILEIETGDTRRLETGPGVCSVGDWSADGGSIVYTRISTGTRKSFNPADADIFIYDLETDTETPLVETPVQESGPCFSPDGRYISFSRTLSQLRRSPRATDADFEIYLLELETNTELRITDDAFHNWAPVWLPSSNSLIFPSDRASENGGSELFLLNLDTDSMSQITDDQAWATYPSISSDGKQVAYQYFKRSEDPENPYNFTCRIHVMDISSRRVIRVQEFGDHCGSPYFRKK